MSEIRSISEGTFVIGDTNGLTFEAGPGISVSQPSEGTVRIANDETVLWETNVTSGADSATLSEPLTNFERVKIKFSAGNDANMNVRACYNEFDTSCWQYNLVGQRTDDGGIVFGVGAFSAANNYTELHRQYGKYYIFSTGNTVIGPGNLNISLFKVIGINRKENA